MTKLLGNLYPLNLPPHPLLKYLPLLNLLLLLNQLSLLPLSHKKLLLLKNNRLYNKLNPLPRLPFNLKLKLKKSKKCPLLLIARKIPIKKLELLELKPVLMINTPNTIPFPP